MKYKIFTTVLTLEYSSTNNIVVGKQAQESLWEIEREVNEFLSDKINATVCWHQSTSSSLELLLEAKGIPFTQVTAIVYW